MKIDIQRNYDEHGRIDNMKFERVDDKNSPDYQFENVTIKVSDKYSGSDRYHQHYPLIWDVKAPMVNGWVHKQMVREGECAAIGLAIGLLLKKRQGGNHDKN